MLNSEQCIDKNTLRWLMSEWPLAREAERAHKSFPTHVSKHGLRAVNCFFQFIRRDVSMHYTTRLHADRAVHKVTPVIEGNASSSLQCQTRPSARPPPSTHPQQPPGPVPLADNQPVLALVVLHLAAASVLTNEETDVPVADGEVEQVAKRLDRPVDRQFPAQADMLPHGDDENFELGTRIASALSR